MNDCFLIGDAGVQIPMICNKIVQKGGALYLMFRGVTIGMSWVVIILFWLLWFRFVRISFSPCGHAALPLLT